MATRQISLCMLATRQHKKSCCLLNVFLGKDKGWNGDKPHHHLINATVCGSWWVGQIDEVGIPHATMNDGAPNGYSVITFDGNQYSVEFKAARK